MLKNGKIASVSVLIRIIGLKINALAITIVIIEGINVCKAKARSSKHTKAGVKLVDKRRCLLAVNSLGEELKTDAINVQVVIPTAKYAK
ncbi:MAG: hypothetical protein ERJ69_08215 [Aphanocapsa feldmannii 288cV]|nr:MAG: hypothetical protein ERJ69_08215 [Aphanocapsa feldmannii 288cV]